MKIPAVADQFVGNSEWCWRRGSHPTGFSKASGMGFAQIQPTYPFFRYIQQPCH
jgi:hypothetical protein